MARPDGNGGGFKKSNSEAKFQQLTKTRIRIVLFAAQARLGRRSLGHCAFSNDAVAMD